MKKINNGSAARRILCLITGILIAVSALTTAYAADKIGAPNAESAAEFLKKIDVFKSYDENALSGSVTRADFAVYAARAIKVNEFEETQDRFFVDLPMESYALASVNALVKSGAVSVDDERSFRPDDTITYAEGLKIMLSLMDYDELAKFRGGYPYGYLNVASKLGISTANSTSELTLGSAAQLIYECMSTNIYDIESVSADGEFQYTNKTDRTLLSIYYSMYRAEGAITAADGASCDDNGGEDGFAVIDGVKYKTDGFDGADEYLGQRVKLVYKRAANEMPILFYIERNTDTDDTLRIDIENYDGYDGDRVYYYSDKNSSSRRNIPMTGVKIVYNGEPLKDKISERLTRMSEGDIYFTDSDSDGKYNYMIINDYKNFSVKSMTNGKNLLYNGLAQDTLDLSQYGAVNVKNSDGASIDISDLATNSILSVAASENKNIIRIIMSEIQAEGVVSEKHTDDGVDVYAIGDKEYYVSKGITDSNVEDITLSRKYMFYINAFGKIVSAKPSEQVMRCGYLCDIKDNGSPFDTVLKFKIFTSDGNLSITDGADKISLDGTRYNSDALDKLVANIPECSVSGGSYSIAPQIILYKVDENDKINQIDTYNTSGGDLVRTTNGVETLTKYTTRFGKKIIFSSAAKVYKVPSDSDVKTADEIDFNIGKVSDFYRSLAYPIEAYKFSKDDEYDDIIVYRTNDSLTESHEWANSNMMMVDSVYDAIDDNGTQTKEISGIISGNMARYTLAESMKAESFSADNIHCGDLIRCRFNSHGQINHIQLLYCADTKTRNGWAEESNTGIYFDKSFGANFQLSFGYVYERGKNVITWGTSIGSDATEAYDITYVPVMVYDASKRDDKVYKGTIDDIAGYDNVGADCDTVILQSMEGVGKALAVFKK